MATQYRPISDTTVELCTEKWPTMPPGSKAIIHRNISRPGFTVSIPSIGALIHIEADGIRDCMRETAEKIKALCAYRLSPVYRCAAGAMRPGRHDRGWPKPLSFGSGANLNDAWRQRLEAAATHG